MKCLHRFSASLLLLGLAMMPSAALALEPIINGASTQVDVQITASGNQPWNILLGPFAVQIPGNSVYHCEVTCTSTVNNPLNFGAVQQYLYAAFNTIQAANPAPANGCVREFDFKQAVFGLDEIDNLAVATTCFIPNLAGAQNFYCLGRRLNAAQDNTNVDNTSMHVTCIDDRGAAQGAP